MSRIVCVMLAKAGELHFKTLATNVLHVCPVIHERVSTRICVCNIHGGQRLQLTKWHAASDHDELHRRSAHSHVIYSPRLEADVADRSRESCVIAIICYSPSHVVRRPSFVIRRPPSVVPCLSSVIRRPRHWIITRIGRFRPGKTGAPV